MYLAAIALVVLYQLQEQNLVRLRGGTPLYRNLMEAPAYIRRGFDPRDITAIPAEGAGWMRFRAPQLRIVNAPLPDLPKRNFLSPWGRDAEEFTIIIPVEMDGNAMKVLAGPALPGIFFAHLGENWEIYLNGHLVRKEMHLDKEGRITSYRNWRDVYFPLEKAFLVSGTNILALRIVGDPSQKATGLYYTAPYYIDDYQTIERRQHKIPLLIFVGVFGFVGFYYLVLFLSDRKKGERFNLYYGIFSMLLCIFSLTRYGIVNYLIPDSNIAKRIEFGTLFMMVPLLCFFIEELGRRTLTKISRFYFGLCALFTATQFFFCGQYGNDILLVWQVSVIVYFSYVFFYSVIYFYLSERRKTGREKRESGEEPKTFILSILAGSVLVYACGILDCIDALFFHNAIGLFLYSTFVFHIGMAFALSDRVRSINRRLELKTQSIVELQNAMLKTMAELVEYRDDTTGGHIERTQRGIKILLEELEKSGVYREEIQGWNVNLLLQSSQLHDVGKISINDNILKKPARLTGEEFNEMKKHTVYGEEIIEKIRLLARESDFLTYAKTFASSHHERWDGSGYPRGLKEDEIPLLGRVMAIADVYDALVSNRPYKKAFSHEETVRIITEGSGTQFDPALIEVFARAAETLKQQQA